MSKQSRAIRVRHPARSRRFDYAYQPPVPLPLEEPRVGGRGLAMTVRGVDVWERSKLREWARAGRIAHSGHLLPPALASPLLAYDLGAMERDGRRSGTCCRCREQPRAVGQAYCLPCRREVNRERRALRRLRSAGPSTARGPSISGQPKGPYSPRGDHTTSA